jgi:hypothetical protein
VLIGCGEIDVVPDPWMEPSAYRGSRDVALFVVERMCHMHNFAQNRELLWDRIANFARSLTKVSLAEIDGNRSDVPAELSMKRWLISEGSLLSPDWKTEFPENTPIVG